MVSARVERLGPLGLIASVILVMQYIEGLTDRQTADAVRCCMDWKDALNLELTDPGFDAGGGPASKMFRLASARFR